MFRPELQRFFLAVPNKAVARLSEAGDSGGPVSTVEAFCALSRTRDWFVICSRLFPVASFPLDVAKRHSRLFGVFRRHNLLPLACNGAERFDKE